MMPSQIRKAVTAGAGLLVGALSADATFAKAPTTVTRDVDYLPGQHYANDKDRLDVHMPAGAVDVPVVVYFHGGALMYGEKELADPVAERLVALGIGVVSANYRLSPDHQHPAHVQDAASSVAWTVAHIAEYGGNPQQIYVGGHSAGAYLAALLALDASHLATHSLDHGAISGSILISPFLYVEETAADRPKVVWGTDPDDWLAASVTPHIGPDKAPMLLIYADGDDPWRRDQNERLAQALRTAGSPSTTAVQMPDRDHRSLITRINEPSDQIGDQIRGLVGTDVNDREVVTVPGN
jgi:acetyl esterase/lipase